MYSSFGHTSRSRLPLACMPTFCLPGMCCCPWCFGHFNMLLVPSSGRPFICSWIVGSVPLVSLFARTFLYFGSKPSPLCVLLKYFFLFCYPTCYFSSQEEISSYSVVKSLPLFLCGIVCLVSVNYDRWWVFLCLVSPFYMSSGATVTVEKWSSWAFWVTSHRTRF
jgi:hypothetical protein